MKTRTDRLLIAVLACVGWGVICGLLFSTLVADLGAVLGAVLITRAMLS